MGSGGVKRRRGVIERGKVGEGGGGGGRGRRCRWDVMGDDRSER